MFRIPGQNTIPNAYLQTADEMLYGHGSPLSLNYKEAEFTTTDTAVLEFTTRGPADTGMWIDWGDGAREWIQHTGTGNDITTNHNYGGLTGTKKVAFSGILADVTKFLCNDSTLGGNIKVLALFRSLTYLNMGYTSISGDIAGIATLTNLSYLYLYNTSISGDIAGIATLTELTVIFARVTSISGDIAGIATLTKLIYLYLDHTSVSGDIADIATLTNLGYLYLYNTSVGYTTTILPVWAGTIKIQDCNLTETEVDNFLIDWEASGVSNGTLNIAGTGGTANAVHSAASDAAITALLGRSCTLTLST